MAESLQRSEMSFRRQGSSGLVWNGEFLAAAAAAAAAAKSDDADAAAAPTKDGGRPYRTVKVPSPSADPPSPKVSGCCLCGMFGKPEQPNKRRR